VGGRVPHKLFNPDTFRRGLFNLRTRRFGRVAELLVQRLIQAAAARSLFHDLYDDAMQHRIEVKFCTVNSASEEPITLTNLLKAVEDAGHERAVPFSDWHNYIFDANVQQIKRVEFDVLYYGLFFSDVIVVFKMTSEQLKTQSEILASGRANQYVNIYFSDRQHKGNIGEGQFHINNQTLAIHLQHFHYLTISYADFIALLRS
jgi:hypothetical protein